MHELYKRKNADYGDSVSKTYEKYGMVSFLVRIEDKINRVKSLIDKGKREVKEEKIEDTLTDLANYAILARIEYEAEKEGKRK